MSTHLTWAVRLSAFQRGMKKRRRETMKGRWAGHWRGSHTTGFGTTSWGSVGRSPRCWRLANSTNAAYHQRWLRKRNKECLNSSKLHIVENCLNNTYTVLIILIQQDFISQSLRYTYTKTLHTVLHQRGRCKCKYLLIYVTF